MTAAMSSILVLADRPADRDLLATVLRYANYGVHPVATVQEALRVAREERPDLIVADIAMPSTSCSAFMWRLRNDPHSGATAAGG